MKLQEFLDEIKSEKYIGIFICIFFILVYNIYRSISACKKNIENMTVSNNIQINEVLSKYYTSENFLKNMSNISQKLQYGGLQIEGNINLTGNVKAYGEISNQNISITKLEKKIDDKIDFFKKNGRCNGPILSFNIGCNFNFEQVYCPNGQIYRNPCFAKVDGCHNCPPYWR